MTHPGTDDLGAAVPLHGAPRRIVSLVPNLSELVADWGLADRLVAVTEHCVEPAGAFPHARRVRGTKNPDLAAVRDLAPDLVLASEEENREQDVRRLRDAGLAVHVTRVRCLADLPDSLTRLGQVLSVPDRARALVERLGTPAPADEEAVRVACAIWRDEPSGGEERWWLLGPDTYAASLLAAAGGHLVPAEPGGRYPRRPLSVLRAAAPDLVLLPDEPYVFGAEEVGLLAAEGLSGVAVDGKALWWWGCRTPAAIDHLAGLLRTASRDRPVAGQ